MKQFGKLWFYLTLIIRPSYHIMNNRYSKAWDDEINNLVLKYKFEKLNEYVALLGNKRIWIANHPYASFVDSNNMGNYRASRYTIYKLRKKLLEDIKPIEQKKAEFYKSLL